MTSTENIAIIMSGTITLEISNATVENPAKSAVHDIGGYKWQLICPDDKFTHAELHKKHFRIECNQQCNNTMWLCNAKFTWKNKYTGHDWTVQRAREDGGGGWGFGGFSGIGQEHQTEPRLWFNGHNQASTQFMGNPDEPPPEAIQVTVEVLWSARGLPKLDASLKMTFGKESALIPINRYILAAHSDYFDNIFFNKTWVVEEEKLLIGEDGNSIHEIKEDAGFNLSQFRYMVYGLFCMSCLYSLDMKLPMPDCQPDDDDEDEEAIECRKMWSMSLLKLAVKYHLQMFVDMAEKRLIALGDGTMELLKFAEEWTLTELKRHCLDSIHPVDFCKDFEYNCEQRALLKKETRDQLAEAWQKAFRSTPRQHPYAQHVRRT